MKGKLHDFEAKTMPQPTGAPAVKVTRVRPALVFPQEEAGRLLKAAKARDVIAGGVFSAGPAGVQVWSEPWNGEDGTMGTSVHLGSVDWTYNTPTQFYITVYRCMVTQEGPQPRPGSGRRPQTGARPGRPPDRGG
jgi:hypothetical protein